MIFHLFVCNSLSDDDDNDHDKNADDNIMMTMTIHLMMVTILSILVDVHAWWQQTDNFYFEKYLIQDYKFHRLNLHIMRLWFYQYNIIGILIYLLILCTLIDNLMINAWSGHTSYKHHHRQ